MGSIEYGPAVLASILPAAQSTKGDASISQLDVAIQQNVRNQVAALGASPAILQRAVAAGKLKIVGAEYQLASGRVKLLDRGLRAPASTASRHGRVSVVSTTSARATRSGGWPALSR